MYVCMYPADWSTSIWTIVIDQRYVQLCSIIIIIIILIICTIIIHTIIISSPSPMRATRQLTA